MPYRCVHCSATYEDTSSELSKGCVCGSKFFFYMSAAKLAQLVKERETTHEEEEQSLTMEEKSQVEEEVREIAGLQDQPETPVFLDFESVKIVKPGKYLIDIDKLLAKSKPKVYQLEDGKYIVDLAGTG